ncbi:bifunctional glutamate N-acetyltransferase/amino-acid acetyltransferase ArgJ [Streptomyces sp. TLI_171]|uniref:bifunctional glutamate N-acetyltransferase/amino-acid acetyltransferase ArgJ n=1 Tax=Streptomyces sp. TLI_171 TaxID=1938859 RepID=UPI000C177B5C|nr:bifunctional glutamate N-acetyltransferase/amino-acid acetyltransferase ArgJ [Streptomyces sp. TLI_171]RKE20434.1 glutamate N-acetyltransferase [Streptomyces sp. TLI_171]
MRSDLPRGFRGVTAHLGVKESAADFALVVSEVPAHSAAVFTQSRFAGPSVALSRADAPRRRSRGMVAVSGNANVATGPDGAEEAAELRVLAAELAGVDPGELVVASTGVIGRRYPMDRIRAGLAALPARLPEADFAATARAIMTTDTRPKQVTVTCGDAVLTAVAKGVGMIEPNMATLLTFFFTDAELPADVLDAVFRRVMDRTFNALSIDTDTSTSDTAAIFANGLAGPVDHAEFERALHRAALHLVREIARDGEGASKLIEVRATGARDDAQAKRVAKAVVNSPLVKTAVHGADPNWGRVAMAIGKLHEETDLDPDRVRIRFGDLEVYPAPSTEELLAAARRHLEADEVLISVELGVADGAFTVYGCDLTEGYVKINAD